MVRLIAVFLSLFISFGALSGHKDILPRSPRSAVIAACKAALEKSSFPLKPLTSRGRKYIDKNIFYEFVPEGNLMRNALPWAEHVIVIFFRAPGLDEPRPIFVIGVRNDFAELDEFISYYSLSNGDFVSSKVYLDGAAKKILTQEFGEQVQITQNYQLQGIMFDPIDRTELRFFNLPGVYAGSGIYGEALMKQTLPRLPKKKSQKILVLGSGNGMDAVALARHTRAVITASDIDPGALHVIRLNAQLNKVNITAVQSDLLAEVQGKFDLIIFNAPRPIMWELWPSKAEWTEEENRKYFADKFEGIEQRPAFFDPQGKLLTRLISQLDGALTERGQLLIMTDANIEKVLPREWKAKKLSEDFPWGPSWPAYFAIFSITRR